MEQRRVGAAFLGIAAFVLWAAPASLVAQNKDNKKQTDSQKKDTQAAVKAADDAMAGQPAPNDLSASWAREDFLKAQGNKEYVPFTVSIDPSKLNGATTVAFYWRVVPKEAAAAAAAPAGQKKDEKDKDKKDKGQKYPYEDISFSPVTPGQTPLRISRSFTVSSGTYDVYVVAKEPTPDKAPKNAPPAKTSVIKQTVTVPDFWNSELNTSSVIVTEKIDPLPAPLTPEQQADRPYAMGTMELLPRYDMKFTKKGEIQTFMLIYNPQTDKANKPDVSVEYNFCQVSAGTEPKPGEPCKPGEKFFNKTNPQNLNAQTLPPIFDMAAGHQLQTGQAVPLASFPEGQYRLEIKVTDNIAKKSLTRDVNFTVSS
ncbi:MAG TPA: hypothetical protein VEU08_16340 [Vicinamibacterales bacterium]|nr:hypothetical protein [Vicinamibacterales bacterium]